LRGILYQLKLRLGEVVRVLSCEVNTLTGDVVLDISLIDSIMNIDSNGRYFEEDFCSNCATSSVIWLANWSVPYVQLQQRAGQKLSNLPYKIRW
jgi:hypothetical protein